MPRRVVSKRQEFQHSILVYTLLRFCGAGGRDVDSFVEVKACVRGTEIVVARRLHPSRGIFMFFSSRGCSSHFWIWMGQYSQKVKTTSKHGKNMPDQHKTRMPRPGVPHPGAHLGGKCGAPSGAPTRAPTCFARKKSSETSWGTSWGTQLGMPLGAPIWCLFFGGCRHASEGVGYGERCGVQFPNVLRRRGLL